MTAREFDGMRPLIFERARDGCRWSFVELRSHLRKCVKYWAELHLRYPCWRKPNPSVKQFLDKCYGALYLGALADGGPRLPATPIHNFNKEPP